MKMSFLKSILIILFLSIYTLNFAQTNNLQTNHELIYPLSPKLVEFIYEQTKFDDHYWQMKGNAGNAFDSLINQIKKKPIIKTRNSKYNYLYDKFYLISSISNGLYTYRLYSNIHRKVIMKNDYLDKKDQAAFTIENASSAVNVYLEGKPLKSKKGVFYFSSKKKTLMLKIIDKDRIQFVQLVRNERNSYDAHPISSYLNRMGYPDNKYEMIDQVNAYMVLNKSKYKPSDTVKYKLFVGMEDQAANELNIKVGLYEQAYYRGEPKAIWTKIIQVNEQGTFEGEFVLGDSIAIDKSYRLATEFTEDNPKELKEQLITGASFYYEDYQLDQVKFSFDMLNPYRIFLGDSLNIKLNVLDVFNEAVDDAIMKYHYTFSGIYGCGEDVWVDKALFNKDSSIYLDQEENIKMNLSVPTEEKVSFYGGIDIELANSKNEMKTFNRSFNYSCPDYHLKEEDLNDTIAYRLFYGSKEVTGEKGERKQNRNDEQGQSITFPYKVAFKDFNETFRIHVKGIDKYCYKPGPNIRISNYIIEDGKVKISLMNPRGLEIKFQIKNGLDEVVFDQTYIEKNPVVDLTIEDKDFWIAKLFYNGNEYGERYISTNQRDVFYETELSSKVLPGEKSRIKVKARDINGNALSNLNFTASALNSLLDPVRGNYRKGSFQQTEKEIDKDALGIPKDKKSFYHDQKRVVWDQDNGFVSMEDVIRHGLQKHKFYGKLMNTKSTVFVEKHKNDEPLISVFELGDIVSMNHKVYAIKQDGKWVYGNNSFYDPIAIPTNIGDHKLEVFLENGILYTFPKVTISKNALYLLYVNETSEEVEISTYKKEDLDLDRYMFTLYSFNGGGMVTDGHRTYRFYSRTNVLGPFTGDSLKIFSITDNSPYLVQIPFKHDQTYDVYRAEYIPNQEKDTREQKRSYKTNSYQIDVLDFDKESKRLVDQLFKELPFQSREEHGNGGNSDLKIYMGPARSHLALMGEDCFLKKSSKRYNRYRDRSKYIYMDFNHLKAGKYVLVALEGDKIVESADTIILGENGVQILYIDDHEFKDIRSKKLSLEPIDHQSHYLKDVGSQKVQRLKSAKLRFEGTVFDEKDNFEVPFVKVVLWQNKKPIAQTFTDMNGQYSFDIKAVGKYDLTFESRIYFSKIIPDIGIRVDEKVLVDVEMSDHFEEFIITKDSLGRLVNVPVNANKNANRRYYKKADYRGYQLHGAGDSYAEFEMKTEAVPQEHIIENIEIAEEESIDELADVYVNDPVTSTMSTAAKKDDGEAPSAAGARTDGNSVYIDGVKVINGISENSIRSTFRDYAFWQPTIITDENGEASFEVTYPDDIANWDVSLNGMTQKGHYGSHHQMVKAFKPYVVQLFTPRFVLSGDQFEVIGSTKSFEDSTANIQTFIGGEAFNHELKSKKSITDKSGLIQTKRVDTMKMTYQVKVGDYKDGEERKIPVLPVGMEYSKGKFTTVAKDTLFTWTLEENTPVQIHVGQNMLEEMISSLDYLEKYPHYCMEQTASKLIGFMLQKEIAKRREETFKRNKQIKKLTKKLLKSKNEKGFWGWWQNGTTNYWMTFYVAQALQLAGEEAEVQKVIELLTKDIAYIPKNVNLLYLLDFLAQNNADIDYKEEIKLYKMKRSELSLIEQILIEKIKKNADMDYQLKALLSQKKVTVLGGVYWGEETYRFWDNEMQATLLMYDFLKSIGGYDNICTQMIQYFLEKRGGRHWGNTIENAQIVKRILASIEGNGAEYGEMKVWINGKKLKEDQSDMTIHNANVNIKVKGEGLLFITAYQDFWDSNPEKKDDVYDVVSYFEQKGEKVDQLEEGGIYQYKIEIDAKKKGDYIMIEAPIPASCMYNNKHKMRGEVHREYYKDKTYIYIETMKEGKHIYTIDLQARFKGNYTINPAKVELMYFPIFYGNNELKKVTVD